MAQEYLSELQFATWCAFLKACTRVADQLDQDLVAAGCIPVSCYEALSELHRAPEHRLPANELITRILSNRRGVTYQADRLEAIRLVSQLEADGFLTHGCHEADNSETFLVPTEQGVVALQRAWPIYAQGVALYFAQGMNEIQTEHFEESLHLMMQACDQKANDVSLIPNLATDGLQIPAVTLTDAPLGSVEGENGPLLSHP